MTKKAILMIAGAVALAAVSGAAWAQRDPAYAAARAAGEVGEQPDGYLGVVGGGNAQLRRLNSASGEEATLNENLECCMRRRRGGGGLS